MDWLLDEKVTERMTTMRKVAASKFDQPEVGPSRTPSKTSDI